VDYITITSAPSMVTVLADDFANDLTGWTTVGSPDTCSCASGGDHMVWIRGNEILERTISTAGYTSIVVSFDHFQFALPAAANGNPNFALKFLINCSGWSDNGRFDDIQVLGTN
jgi:hypothetical protein